MMMDHTKKNEKKVGGDAPQKKLKLKKIFFTAVCLLFLGQVHAQSLSVKELAGLLTNPDKVAFLKSRSFTTLGTSYTEKGVSQHFLKSMGSKSQETIVVTTSLVSYLTHSKSYINNLLAQLKQHFKPAVHNENSETIYYVFKIDESKNVSINISKTDVSYYSLEVVKK
jgi:hypothetical protein